MWFSIFYVLLYNGCRNFETLNVSSNLILSGTIETSLMYEDCKLKKPLEMAKDAQGCSTGLIYSSANKDDITDYVLDKEKFEIIRSALKKLNQTREYYLKSKKIVQALEDIANNDEIAEEKSFKIKKTIHLTSLSLSQDVVDSACEELNILGLTEDVTNDRECRLSPAEMKELDVKVNEKLEAWCSRVQNFHDIVASRGLTNFVDQPVDPKTLLRDNQMELDKARRRICSKMEERWQLAQEISAMQMQVYLSTCKSEADNIIQHRKTAVQAQHSAGCVLNSIESLLVCDDVDAVTALRSLHEQVDRETESADLKLKRLKAKMAAYDQLNSNEFAKIVQQYTKAKTAAKRTRWVLDELNMSSYDL